MLDPLVTYFLGLKIVRPAGTVTFENHDFSVKEWGKNHTDPRD